MPTETSETVLAATVQTVGVVDAKITALPDAPPVALKRNVPPALYGSGVAGEKLVIVCAIRAAEVTVNDCTTCAAAL